jgi:hypothetical protein
VIWLLLQVGWRPKEKPLAGSLGDSVGALHLGHPLQIGPLRSSQAARPWQWSPALPKD